jgi:site-specific recombinase XerD
VVGHRPKTLEWHQTVLAHLHQYLQAECHLVLVHQFTETALRNWLERLAQEPNQKGTRRSASTIETYARSARAFCGWLVEQGVLSCSPLSERLFPRSPVPLPHMISPALFGQIMRAGFSPPAPMPGAKRLLARDQALLWVLFDTGITVTELCALRVADVDQQKGLLRVRGKGGKERLLPLGRSCQCALRSYLRQMNSATCAGMSRCSRSRGSKERSEVRTRKKTTHPLRIRPQLKIVKPSYSHRLSFYTGVFPEGMSCLEPPQGKGCIKKHGRGKDLVLALVPCLENYQRNHSLTDRRA